MQTSTCPPSRQSGPNWLGIGWVGLCLSLAAFCVYKAAPSSGRAVAAQATKQTAGNGYEMRGIAEFAVNDTLLAFNHGTGRVERRRVANLFRNISDHLRILTFRSPDGTTQTIKTTDEHPFWLVDENEYFEAKDLQVGSKVIGPKGELQELASTIYEPHPEGVPVYNVEVEDLHNYFVAVHGARAPPLLAHNTCAAQLRKALIANRFVPNDVAHHIVARGAFSNRNLRTQIAAERSRDILARHGIGIDEHFNGVFLSYARHGSLHTNRALQEVHRRLRQADSAGRTAVIDALARIRGDIVSGSFP